MNNKMIKRIISLILISVMVLCATTGAFAEDVSSKIDTISEYNIMLGADGLLSGCDHIDETVHTIGEQQVKKTYVLLFRDENFSIVNETGITIDKNTILLANGENPTEGRFFRGSIKSAEYLNASMKARFIRTDTLTDAGYKELDEEASAFYYLYFSAMDYALLIQITPNGVVDPFVAARETLKEQMDRVSGVHEDDFYHANDRYNGKTTSEKGFWAELQETLAKAQVVYEDPLATIERLEHETEMLGTAIEKLLPSKCVNPTALYEKVNACKESYEEADHTKESWNQYELAMTQAQGILDNILIDGELLPASEQAVLEQLVKAIDSAEKNLLKKYKYEYAVNAKEYLPDLVRLVEGLNPSDYTTESWSEFYAAYTKAKDIIKSDALTGMSDDLMWKNTFDDLYHAYYWGLVPSHDININLTILDPIAARQAGEGSVEFGVKEPVKISNGFKLNDVVTPYGVTFPEWISNWDNVNVFINGVHVVNGEKSTSFEANVLYNRKWTDVLYDAENLSMHPNDDVVVTFDMNPLTYHSPVVGTSRAMFTQYCESLYTSQFVNTGEYLTVQAGEKFEVQLKKTSALIETSGKTIPADNMTLFTSQPQDTKGSNAPAKTKMMNNGSPVITDEAGKATLSLYDEGWVLLNAYDLREDILGDATDGELVETIENGTYYSLNSGAAIWVHVVPNNDPEDVKDALIDELDKAYKGCNRITFPKEALDNLDQLYATAQGGISAASTIGEARSAQQTGISAILELKESIAKDNKDKVSTFRKYLKQLPEDIDLISKTQEEIVSNLITSYEVLTDYQKTLLTSAEKEKYEKITSIATLPDARKYNVNVKIEADNAAAAATLADMQKWLSENISYEDVKEGSEIKLNAGMDQIRFGTPYELVYKDYKGSYGKMPEYSADFAPGTEMFLNFNYNYSSYYHVRNADDHAIYGDGWKIVDDQKNGLHFADRSYMNYTVTGGVTVLIGDTEYEIKNVKISGVDKYEEHDLPDAIMDRTTYKGKDLEFVNLWFKTGIYTFDMPYNDVDVVVSWGPVHDVENDALNELTRKYNSYVRGNYTDSKWKELTSIYQEGVSAIMEAADPAGTKDQYSNRMDAVESIGAEAEYGYVTVTVRNNTMKDGDWYDETEAFINETVELNESDTMMTVALRALEENGCSWNGTGGSVQDSYSITYISSITQGPFALSEKMPGYPGSGWMGMLNDWFVNQGFQAFSVENGGLKNGDRIDLVFTCDLGLDVRSGMEGIDDTRVRNIALTNGTLSPAFDGKSTDYVFVLDKDKNTAVLEFESEWRCFQSRAYKNKYTPDAEGYYKSGDSIVLKNGDVIYVAAGDPAWPSMSGNSGIALMPFVYKISVVTAEAIKQAEDLINGLAKIKYSNYESLKNAVISARTAYDALADASKAEMDPVVYEKLIKAEKLIAEYTALDQFIEKLGNADAVTVDDETAKELVTTYENMSENQTSHLSLAEKNKVESLKMAVAYDWSTDHATCTATIRNRFDEKDTYSETVTATKTVVREVSETTSGKETYKAVFVDERFTEQVVTLIIPKLGQEEEPGTGDNDKPDTPGPGGNDKPDSDIPTPDKTPVAGEVISVSGASYQIIDGSAVAYATAEKVTSTVTIPDTVNVAGKTYKVTEIKKNAFKNNKKLKKVTIGKNIKKIGSKAFYNCKKLKTINVKTTKLTKKSIGKNAFKKISKKAVIKVPKKKLKTYKTIFKKAGFKGKVKK